jgi:hypothetical protein
MGRTYKRNDRWKKDRKDHSFRNSKKFKDFKGHQPHHKPIIPQSEPLLEGLSDDIG